MTTLTASPAPVTHDRMTTRQRLVLVLLLGSQFMLAVDFSILNVALPVIGAGLGFPLADLQWVATTFALAAAGFTLLSGRVADLFGRRRLFMIGMALLGASSLAGGLASSPGMLLAARVAQGVATAIVTPAGLSLLTTSFSEGPMRARALGLNGALMSAGFTSGAMLGGLLTDLLSWRWAFFVNVPVALAVLVATPALLQESRPAHRPRMDLAGAVTVTAGLLALVFGLTRTGEHGFADPAGLAALAVGTALLVAFWFVERRAAAPLVPVSIMKRSTVKWGNLAGLVAFATETSLVFLMTLYLQKVLGYSALATGLSFGVLGLGTVAGGVVAPRVVARVGTGRALAFGFGTQAVATASLVLLGSAPGWIWLLLAATFVGGIGNMVAIVTFMIVATSGLPDSQQGMATGLATMTQQVGITMGIPIMSAVATAAMGTILQGVIVAVIVNAALALGGAFIRTSR
ncbi:MFS transporter [Nonomuraea sp. NBC_01738]|uniref:MFS transporter n=1 Tax=Nonomuraea sp. NBC_01738 TaxID=2976003 RepID=UPI002E135407|nr:MFS transporter [Nonomuraea sp. NBC_01738]